MDTINSLRRATLMLCDHAVGAEGKLYINGGGWTVAGHHSPWSIALLFEVPWSEIEERQEFSLDLVDADGQPLMLPGPDESEQPLRIEGAFELTRPEELPTGFPLVHPITISGDPLPLEPGTRYEWRLRWQDEERFDWRLMFATRPAPEES